MKKLSKSARMSEKRSYMLSSNQSDVMVAQLVDIEFYPRMSEETLAFNATLQLVHGAVMCSYDCRNDGHGGCTTMRPKYTNSDPSLIDKSKEIFRRWSAHLSTLRDDNFYEVAKQLGWNMPNTGNEVKKNAESEVNNLLAEWCDRHNL